MPIVTFHSCRQRAGENFPCLNEKHVEIPLSQVFHSLIFFLISQHSTGNEDLTTNHRQEPKLSFLIKAIYTLAYGLQAYQEDVCGKDFVGVCPQIHKSFNHSIFFVRNLFIVWRNVTQSFPLELPDEHIFYNC